jgi:DNA (cytosine-5)-methyltransferase 1
MRIGSLFSGIGGLELGLEWSGLGHTVWQVERDEFCRAVLAKHWPEAERFDDVCTVGASTLAPVDLICGGFPCQDVSSAGKGAGLAGERSGLWREFSRVIGEIQPRWVVVENVTSGARRWVDAVVSELGSLGYETLPVPVSARDVGAPHIRARVFLVARLSADANREQLRQQPGGASGSGRERARVAGDARQTRNTGNGNGNGKPAVAFDAQTSRLPQLASRASAWASPPEFRGMDDGVPAALAHRAFGNSVVPQCAEVVGHVIRELIEGGA